MDDVDKEYRLAINLEKIILPKVQSVVNSGNATTIHDANNHLGILLAAKRNAEYFYTFEHVNRYKRYLEITEKWLLELGKRI